MRDVVEDEGEESGLIKGGRERSVGAALHWHRRLSCERVVTIERERVVTIERLVELS